MSSSTEFDRSKWKSRAVIHIISKAWMLLQYIPRRRLLFKNAGRSMCAKFSTHWYFAIISVKFFLNHWNNQWFPIQIWMRDVRPSNHFCASIWDTRNRWASFSRFSTFEIFFFLQRNPCLGFSHKRSAWLWMEQNDQNSSNLLSNFPETDPIHLWFLLQW